MSLGRSLQIACLACRQSHPNLAHMIRQTISQVGLDPDPQNGEDGEGFREGSQGSTKIREGKIEGQEVFACLFFALLFLCIRIILKFFDIVVGSLKLRLILA